MVAKFKNILSQLEKQNFECQHQLTFVVYFQKSSLESEKQKRHRDHFLMYQTFTQVTASKLRKATCDVFGVLQLHFWESISNSSKNHC